MLMKSSKHRLTGRNVNVAVVGLGFMGLTHLKSYEKVAGARVVAVCDAVRKPVNGVLAGMYGNVHNLDAIRLEAEVRVYQEVESLLEDPDVELVDICVPTAMHPALAIAALRAGKHVICEKPIARTSREARAVIEAIQAAKGFFMPAMCMRFWPGWAHLKDLVTKRTYGRVLAARFRRVSAPPSWSRSHYFKGRDSGGALFDLHIHDTDFIQFLFGRPRRVYATGLSRFSGAIDHVVTQYQFKSGITVYAEGSWLLTEGFVMSYTLHFERATVDFDSSRGSEAYRLDTENGRPRFALEHGSDGYVEELKHMVRAIQTGKPPAIVTASDALSSLEICEAEELSIRTGRMINL